MSENTERLERMAVERDCAAKRLEAMSRNDDYVPFSFAGHADREEAAFLLSLIPLVAAGEGAHKPCAKCGKPVCILEDGGPGAELSDGRWACSEECWDALAGPPDMSSVENRPERQTQWQPMKTAPVQGIILLLVEGEDGSERRVFVAEASFDDRTGKQDWCITVGWCGWDTLRNEWRPIGWQSLPQPLPPAPKGGA